MRWAIASIGSPTPRFSLNTVSGETLWALEKVEDYLAVHIHFYFSMTKILRMRILFVLRSYNLSYFPLDSGTRISKKITLVAAFGNRSTPPPPPCGLIQANLCLPYTGRQERGNEGGYYLWVSWRGMGVWIRKRGEGEGFIHFNSTVHVFLLTVSEELPWYTTQ